MKRIPILSAILIFNLITLSACSLLPEPHRIDITQGTVLEQKEVEKLKVGMSKKQIEFILGSPSIEDLYTPNRWDYIYYIDKKGDDILFKRLTTFFSNDTLTHIEGDFTLLQE